MFPSHDREEKVAITVERCRAAKNRLDQPLTKHTPGGINIIADKPITTELPDALTIFKLLFAATQKKYHHVIIFALLINELGVMSTFF